MKMNPVCRCRSIGETIYSRNHPGDYLKRPDGFFQADFVVSADVAAAGFGVLPIGSIGMPWTPLKFTPQGPCQSFFLLWSSCHVFRRITPVSFIVVRCHPDVVKLPRCQAFKGELVCIAGMHS